MIRVRPAQSSVRLPLFAAGGGSAGLRRPFPLQKPYGPLRVLTGDLMGKMCKIPRIYRVPHDLTGKRYPVPSPSRAWSVADGLLERQAIPRQKSPPLAYVGGISVTSP